MSFERKTIKATFLPDILSAFLIFLYAALSTQVDKNLFWQCFKFLVAIVIILQFVIAPVIDHLVYGRISRRIDRFYATETTETERTKLFEDLMQYPMIGSIMTFTYFIIGLILLMNFSILKFNPRINLSILFCIECVFGSFFASLFGYNAVYNTASTVAFDIVKKGINKSYAFKKNYFGQNLSSQLLNYIAYPFIFTTVINIAIVIIGYIPFNNPELWEDGATQLSRMIYTCILNSIVVSISTILFYMNYKKKNSKMTQALEKMTASEFSTTELIDTDISDEFSYNHYLTNEMIMLFDSILQKTEGIANTIKLTSENLSRISNETESTSVEQATGIKEIVSTMENTTKLAHDIENSIFEVTQLAKETVSDVEKGSELLEQNLNLMTMIAESNETTTYGVKDLSERLNSIWEIINIINNISDQTKIIAFNAELEAISQSQVNKNFKNVSNEIRVLANSTIDSTREIKSIINEIQNASENLITASKKSTELISKGKELSAGLEKRFANIKLSAESNATSANDIQFLVEQQTKAFDLIVNTLQQISVSIQNFSLSTRTIIETSEMLNSNVEQLGRLSKINKRGAK